MKAPHPEEVLAKIVKEWRPFLKRMNKSNSEKRLVVITIGTLIGAKVILLLHNDGIAHFTGDSVAWEKLEQFSDDIAEQYFQLSIKNLGQYQGISIRPKSERSYLHLMRNRKDFHWCKTEISENDPVPSGLGGIDGTTNPSFDLARKIIMAVTKWNKQFDKEERQTEFLAVIVGVMAAAKLVLQLWDGKVAAFLEYLADRGSKEEYDYVLSMIEKSQ
jgi:hypothetical protein